MMNLELAGACGVPSTVKVSSFGTPNVEISTMMLFNDWEEHGAKVEEMRSHAKKGTKPTSSTPRDPFFLCYLFLPHTTT